jgi:SAM-dependent methyltransferase
MGEARLASVPALKGAETYSSAMADAKNYISWILASFSDYLSAPVLEIGYGDYIGVDIDPASVDEGRRRFPGLDLRVADITSPEFVALATERKVRTIVCLNVIEHIEDDGKAVTNLARALQPGGHLLVIVPALELLFNDLDRLAGHHRRYSRSLLRSRLTEAGLEIVRCDYFNSIGGLGWLANRALRHKSLNDKAVNSQISLFDKWLVPLSRLADPATRKVFGQSVIAVGRKR